MKRSIKGNKKGVLTEPPVIVGLFFLALLFFLVFFLFSSKPDDTDTDAKKEFESLNQNIILLSYLSAPVNISGISNVADLIILTIGDGNAEGNRMQELKKISERILTPFFEKPYFWGIHVFDRDKEILSFYQEEYRHTLEYNEAGVFEQTIPNQIGKKPEFYILKLIKWED
jgi:hypothetical protein